MRLQAATIAPYYRGADGDEMSGWISIADRLPEPGEEVWIHDKEMGVTIGRYGRGRWYDVYGDNDGLGDDGLYEVTHWMPLPRPDPPSDKIFEASSDSPTLLEYIRWDIAPGIHTYPGRSDNDDMIHSNCLELERQGLIYRDIDGSDHCFFSPVPGETK